MNLNRLRLVYKKIDSTLCGNLGAEIEAILKQMQIPIAVVAPSYPALGRKIVNGNLHLADERQFTGKHLATILALQCKCDVAEIHVGALESGLTELVARQNGLLVSVRKRLIVAVDAETDNDLSLIADVIMLLQPYVLPVGSAGLATQLAPRLLSERRPAVSCLKLFDLPAAVPASDRIVVFVGSKNRVTAAQVEHFARSDNVELLSVTETIPNRAVDAFDRKHHLVVPVSWEPGESEKLYELLQRMQNLPPRAIVLTGGDTAQEIARLAGAQALNLGGGELLPGIVRGTLVGGLLDGQNVITKAGGFGDGQAFVKIAELLTSDNTK